MDRLYLDLKKALYDKGMKVSCLIPGTINIDTDTHMIAISERRFRTIELSDAIDTAESISWSISSVKNWKDDEIVFDWLSGSSLSLEFEEIPSVEEVLEYIEKL